MNENGYNENVLNAFLNPDELRDLYKFCKQVTLEDTYQKADAGDFAGTDKEEEYRTAKAFRYLAATIKLEKMLVAIGYGWN